MRPSPTFWRILWFLAVIAPAAPTLAQDADFGMREEDIARRRYADSIRFALETERLVGQGGNRKTVYRRIRYGEYTNPGIHGPWESGNAPVDLVLRVYAELGVDLCRQLREDLAAHPQEYPPVTAKAPRRSLTACRSLPHFLVFLKRNRREIPTFPTPTYTPGILVVWKLPQGALQIGLVSEQEAWSLDPKVMHLRSGKWREDPLSAFPVVALYRPGD